MDVGGFLPDSWRACRHRADLAVGIIGSAGRAGIRWKDVVLLGLVAGPPTCLGAELSGRDISPYLSLACYTLAAGSLLYVIVALVALAYTASRRLQTSFGLFVGIALMYGTAMWLTLLVGIRSQATTLPGVRTYPSGKCIRKMNIPREGIRMFPNVKLRISVLEPGSRGTETGRSP
jgi:hypothetical protein